MVITSMDINNKEFKKSLRGYDCGEVDEFLDKVSEDYEVLYKDNSSLKEKIELLEEQIKHYSKIESTIQHTLILAQNAAEQAKQCAKSESEMILKQSNDAAKKIIDKAHNDVVKINEDYDGIKQEFLRFRTKFRNFMNSQVDTFNELEKEFMKEYNIGNALEANHIHNKEVIHKEETMLDLDSTKLDTIKDFNNSELDSIKSFFVKES